MRRKKPAVSTSPAARRARRIKNLTQWRREAVSLAWSKRMAVWLEGVSPVDDPRTL